MEINIKIHVEQRAPPGVHRQRSDERDEQTDKQTNKKTQRFWPPDGGWNPSPIKLGTVIEDLKHVLSPGKLLGVRRIVSPLGALQI